MTDLIPDIGGVIAFLVVAPFVATLVRMALFSKSEPIPVRERDDSQRVYIRCNDWEFIPATVADLLPGDEVVSAEDYDAMQAMEAADRNRRIAAENHAFWAAVAEADEDDEDIDDLFTDLGGEG